MTPNPGKPIPNPAPKNINKTIDAMPPDGPWRLIALMLSQTGARVGEIAHLKCHDIDMEVGTITLAGKGRERLVLMTEDIKETLGSAPDKSPYVTGMKPEMVAWRFGLELQKACAAAGVPLLRPHDLRRMAFELLLEDGMDIDATSIQLGHTPRVAIAHYAS